ncbi:hypothetical protein CRYUN_Cryun35bG0052900 [Craigia yunnanensis]
MDIPQEIDDYIKETIEDSLGLQISTQSLQLKLCSVEEAQRRLRDKCLFLLSKFKEKDRIIERSKAEANMNAVALKRFVEENQKLSSECANLLTQCNKWERECSLYDHDREALMDFGNEADERAKEAETRVHELEEELGKLTEELRFYKQRYESQGIDSSSEGTTLEENLLESVLATLICKDEVMPGRAFLESNNPLESCQRLLKMWNRLRPSTQKVLSLAAEVKTLEKDKEHLRMNLSTAEEEVKVLFEENKILDEENKRLLRQYHKEKNLHGSGSGGKHTGSASSKTNKRKSSPKICSPIEKKIDFTDLDSARKPLSPLRYNSPDSRMHKSGFTDSFSEATLSMHNKTRNRGLAFVSMASPEEALAALNNLESYELEGRTLRLNYAKPKKKKSVIPQKPKPVPAFNLFVANLSYEARAKHLKEFFSSEGANVVSYEVIFHDNPRKSSGYGCHSNPRKSLMQPCLLSKGR